jgi:hypothetical protein
MANDEELARSSFAIREFVIDHFVSFVPLWLIVLDSFELRSKPLARRVRCKTNDHHSHRVDQAGHLADPGIVAAECQHQLPAQQHSHGRDHAAPIECHAGARRPHSRGKQLRQVERQPAKIHGAEKTLDEDPCQKAVIQRRQAVKNIETRSQRDQTNQEVSSTFALFNG